MKTPQKLEFSLRHMNRRDMEEVLRIDRASYLPALDHDELVDQLAEHTCLALVADCEEEVVAYMLYHLAEKKIIIQRIATEPVFRRLGVASALVERLIAKLNPLQRATIEMVLSDQNLSGHLFLHHLGFAAVSILRDYIEDGHDAYLFEYSTK